MRKPRLVTQTAFLNVVRRAYDGFRSNLIRTMQVVRLRAEAEQEEDGKEHKAMIALNNLHELLEVDIPTIHDYFCYLKVSMNQHDCAGKDCHCC